ncbi:MAG: ParB/RepB/Spo0J family partition protein [Planctomycetaceae bacterium]|nr:ParB/RepB/Spo0J family partition protein [Planctomycetaceae bacterium]
MANQTIVENVSTKPRQEVLSIEVARLHPHPANPNRLGEARFNKLVRQIERTSQYEPIVVRRHPSRRGAYQILNGHHRVRALRQLGYARADCVVFGADDEQALVYLATLNRLAGRDNPLRKAVLIEQICRNKGSRQLAKVLPESPGAIEKLAAFARGQLKAQARPAAAMLVPLTFFVSPSEHEMLCQAFEKAAGSECGTRTQRRLLALKRMAEEFLRKCDVKSR